MYIQMQIQTKSKMAEFQLYNPSNVRIRHRRTKVKQKQLENIEQLWD